MISFVLFAQASQPSMNFNISELVYFASHLQSLQLCNSMYGRVRPILDPSAYGFKNACVSSGKLCAGVAKIWLLGPHSACSLIQPRLFASFLSTSPRKSCAASVLELKEFI